MANHEAGGFVEEAPYIARPRAQYLSGCKEHTLSMKLNSVKLIRVEDIVEYMGLQYSSVRCCVVPALILPPCFSQALTNDVNMLPHLSIN